jgi:hypothetical protein
VGFDRFFAIPGHWLASIGLLSNTAELRGRDLRYRVSLDATLYVRALGNATSRGGRGNARHKLNTPQRRYADIEGSEYVQKVKGMPVFHMIGQRLFTGRVAVAQVSPRSGFRPRPLRSNHCPAQEAL